MSILNMPPTPAATANANEETFFRRILFRLTPLTTNITRLYIASLTVIALLSLLGQLLVQYELAKQSDDASIVNIAGRQRMLSQRLAKTALTVRLTHDNTDVAQWQSELALVIEQWQAAI